MKGPILGCRGSLHKALRHSHRPVAAMGSGSRGQHPHGGPEQAKPDRHRKPQRPQHWCCGRRKSTPWSAADSSRAERSPGEGAEKVGGYPPTLLRISSLVVPTRQLHLTERTGSSGHTTTATRFPARLPSISSSRAVSTSASRLRRPHANDRPHQGRNRSQVSRIPIRTRRFAAHSRSARLRSSQPLRGGRRP